MNEIQVGTFSERLTVNAAGMGELNRERGAGLIYELAQNVFDEESASVAAVTARYIEGKGVSVVVRDDGAGFANPRDMFEIFGYNAKRAMPEKRGRFNLGEKQALSVAVEGAVKTVGYTVEFPAAGGRVVKRNRRKSGTEVYLLMPWTEQDAQYLIDKLRMVRPPGSCVYRVNGKRVTHPKPLLTRDAALESVLQGSPGEPMRRTRRKTTLEISRPASRDGKGWLYEMGLPIQAIDAPYDVDVQQKVPLNPNRDTVGEAYLQDIYSELLNAMHDLMPNDEFGETWVRTAVEDSRISDDAARETVRRRYGDKVALWSSDRNANMEAIDKGWQVVHPRAMSRDEREHLRERGGLQSASALFGQRLGNGDNRPEFRVVDVSDDPVKRAFAEWVRELGGYAGVEVSPVFIHNPKSFALADCARESVKPVMRFNLARLDDEFFAERGQRQLALVIHELGHALASGQFSHGYSWGEGCSRAGAMIALNLA